MAEERTSCGALRDVKRAEHGEPGLCRREALDQVGAAESRHHDRFARGEQFIHQSGLTFWQPDGAFAVRHAHKQRRDRHVVAIRRWQLDRFNFDEPRVRAHHFQRIHPPAALALEVFAGIGI